MSIAWPLNVVPVLMVIGYTVLYQLDPSAFARWAQGELGVVELATALTFAWTAVLACDLATRAQRVRPFYRGWYLAFGLLTLFVALEEINYGQQLFGWRTPAVLIRHNLQSELNLHNLFGSWPGKRLTAIADGASWLLFLAVPTAWSIWQRSARVGYPRASWPYFLLPRLELIPLVLLTRAVLQFRDLPMMAPDSNELRELLWGWTAFAYILLLRRRLSRGSVAVPLSAQLPGISQAAGS